MAPYSSKRLQDAKRRKTRRIRTKPNVYHRMQIWIWEWLREQDQKQIILIESAVINQYGLDDSKRRYYRLMNMVKDVPESKYAELENFLKQLKRKD